MNLIDTMNQALAAAEVLEKLFKQAEKMHEGSIPGVNVVCQIDVDDLRKGLYAAPVIREALAAPLAPAQYTWPTVADYERDVGFKTNEAFRMGWRMARTTNKMLGIEEQS